MLYYRGKRLRRYYKNGRLKKDFELTELRFDPIKWFEDSTRFAGNALAVAVEEIGGKPHSARQFIEDKRSQRRHNKNR